MAGSWRRSMLSALVATLARPDWWLIALAAFLVRGGGLLVVLPIVALPSPASLATSFAPTIEALAFGGPSVERFVLIGGGVVAAGAVIALSGLAGAWLDLAQLRDAAADDDLDLRWSPAHASAREALALRLTAHIPTLLALGYAAVRLVGVAYDELISPADPTTSVVIRVLAGAPEALVLLVGAWLLGETVGSLAGRRAAAGAGTRAALWASTRQLVTVRGAATLLVTTALLAAALVPFLLAAERAREHLAESLLGDADPLAVAAALLVMIGVWVLGLAVLGAVLAWRGAAWTAEVAPWPAATETAPRPEPAPEALGG